MNKWFAVLALLSLTFCTSSSLAQQGKPRSLLGGEKLIGWHADVPAADENPDIDASFIWRDGMLVSMGEPQGHLVSDAVYENYRLEVEYRFADKPGNCGVLVHASTPRALYGMFPKSIEVQMHSGNAGDFWCIGENIAVDQMAERRAGDPNTWGGGPGDSRRILNLTDGSENPVGEWNRMVIECLGDNIRVWVNGDLVNDGYNCTAQRGHIAIQAEGTEVEFRKIDITPISALSEPNAWSDTDEQGQALGNGPVRVFILAGQSNMEGKAKVELLRTQAHDPQYADLLGEYVDDQGELVERPDIWIDFLDRHGRLAPGFGSPGRIGVELGFGSVVGDAIDDPVVLIKTAWGGKSLVRDFRPPSAKAPPDTEMLAIAQVLNKDRRRKGKPDLTIEDVRSRYGASYRDMIRIIRDRVQNLGKEFPELSGRKVKLSGFVWFQGWNDQYDRAETQYEDNLIHLIRDVRKDLNAPDMPVVIGVMGQNGSAEPSEPMRVIQEAQRAVAKRAEFAGTVVAVDTAPLVDMKAQELYAEWKERPEEWDRVGSDHPYHYFGSAVWYTRIGRAFGQAMLSMRDSNERP